MENKRIPVYTTLPPSIMRLAAVLAEIAQNEAVSAPIMESFCTDEDTDKQEKGNPSEGQK